MRPLPAMLAHTSPVRFCTASMSFSSSAVTLQKLYDFMPCDATDSMRLLRGMSRGNMISILAESEKPAGESSGFAWPPREFVVNAGNNVDPKSSSRLLLDKLPIRRSRVRLVLGIRSPLPSIKGIELSASERSVPNCRISIEWRPAWSYRFIPR